MSSSEGIGYWWCLKHNRVEPEENACAAKYRLGPYGTVTEAESALDKVAERNAAWEAEDARWQGK